MKCSQCEKPATFHITELTGPDVEEVHLCEACAREYLAPAEEDMTPSVAGALAHQLKMGQTAEELAQLDQRSCPVCGITFYEFRNQGRLGCPYDYTCFAAELEPLIANIHGETKHLGKTPKKHRVDANSQTDLIRLRREMHDAVQREDYEKASQLRDQIRKIEQGHA